MATTVTTQRLIPAESGGRCLWSPTGFYRVAQRMRYRIAMLCMTILLFGLHVSAQAKDPIRIGVLENSPPMSWRDHEGNFKGYSIDMLNEVCHELGWACTFIPSTIAGAIGDLRSDRIDIAGMSLLPTEERRAQILLARPYYTSFTVWFARSGTRPDDPGIRVAVVSGSAQARFANAHGWKTVETARNDDLSGLVINGKADGMLAPMMTVLGFRTNPSVQAMNLIVQPMNEPELTGATSFGISPNKPLLKTKVDGALEKLERNGTYDRINSRYVPFRVN